ncbi:molybdenum cofactor guanylyltransferase [Ruania rhizosphaerae]|uniref:molybdenum cofactor guanylyltransferase n=1 Tax=Ruania rhizosphaerae TaxID=1840413 RepID=UPI001F3808FE|nr:NTP transferase domain-containing protein [Ruania rhizosphaerae]
MSDGDPTPRPGAPAGVVRDAVVLAGGRASRLGGADKPSLEVGGQTLLHRALRASAGSRRTVVVGPEHHALPDGVLRTREEPAFAGPVAALHAGLQALSDAIPPTSPRTAGPAPWVLLLAADLPNAEEAVADLLSVAAHAETGTDGVCLQDPEGRWQWLAGLHRRTSLQSALDRLGQVEGASLRQLLSPLRLRAVTSSAGRDVDTEDDLRAARSAQRLADSAPALRQRRIEARDEH